MISASAIVLVIIVSINVIVDSIVIFMYHSAFTEKPLEALIKSDFCNSNMFIFRNAHLNKRKISFLAVT